MQVNGKVPRNFIKFGALLASNAAARGEDARVPVLGDGVGLRAVDARCLTAQDGVALVKAALIDLDR